MAHLPSFKDNLAKDFKEYNEKFGESDFDFLAKGYVIPEEKEALEKAWKDDDQLWMLKRPRVSSHIINDTINEFTGCLKNKQYFYAN